MEIASERGRAGPVAIGREVDPVGLPSRRSLRQAAGEVNAGEVAGQVPPDPGSWARCWASCIVDRLLAPLAREPRSGD